MKLTICCFSRNTSAKFRKIFMCFVLSFLIANIFVLTFPHMFISNVNIPVRVSATGEISTENKNNTSEVWIHSVSVNGRVSNLSRIKLSDGWERRFHGNAIVSYRNQPAELMLYFPAGDIVIGFAQHPWSGIVEVECSEALYRFDLFADGDETKLLHHITLVTPERYLSDYAISVILVFLMLLPVIIFADWIFRKLFQAVNREYFFIAVFLSLISTSVFIPSRFTNKQSLSELFPAMVVMCLFYLASILIYFFLIWVLTQKKIVAYEIVAVFSRVVLGLLFLIQLNLTLFSSRWDLFSLFLFLIILSIITTVIPNMFNVTYIRKHIDNKWRLGFFIFIIVYSCFALLYRPFVIENILISGELIAGSFLVVFLVYAGILVFLDFTDNARRLNNKLFETPKMLMKEVIPLFLIVFVGLLVWWVAYFPGNMSVDSFHQWLIVLGERPMSNHHPVAHNWWLIATSLLTQLPAETSFHQVLFSSIVCVFSLWTIRKYGLSLKFCFVFAILFATSVTVGIYSVTLWKDVMFALATQLSVVAMIKIVEHDVVNKWDCALIVIAFFTMCTLRHNGFIAFIFCMVAMFLYVLIKKQRKLLVAGCVTLLMLFSYNIYVRSLQGFAGAEGLMNFVLFRGLATIAYYEGPERLNELSFEIMERAMPMEEWLESYQPYNRSNYWFRTEHWQEYRALSVGQDTRELFEAWLPMFQRYPFRILQGHLMLSNTVWDVQRPNLANRWWPRANFWNKNPYVEFQATWDNPIREFLDNILAYTSDSPFISPILWRGGIYVIINFIMMYYVVSRRLYSRLLAFLPNIGHTISLLILSANIDFRYVYYLFFTTGFIFLYVIADNRSTKESELIETNNPNPML